MWPLNRVTAPSRFTWRAAHDAKGSKSAPRTASGDARTLKNLWPAHSRPGSRHRARRRALRCARSPWYAASARRAWRSCRAGNTSGCGWSDRAARDRRAARARGRRGWPRASPHTRSRTTNIPHSESARKSCGERTGSGGLLASAPRLGLGLASGLRLGRSCRVGRPVPVGVSDLGPRLGLGAALLFPVINCARAGQA
jgi:hypothetical protein